MRYPRAVAQRALTQTLLHRALGCLSVLLALWFTSGAVAQTPSAPTGAQSPADEMRDEEARQLFEAGRVAFTAGRFQSALDSFRRAHELSGRPLLLYNIGTCYDRLRRDKKRSTPFAVTSPAFPTRRIARKLRLGSKCSRERRKPLSPRRRVLTP